MRTEVRNRIEMLGKDAAAELPASQPGKRRWVSVLAVPDRHPNDPAPPPPGRYRVTMFEIDAGKLDDDYSPYDQDLEDKQVRWADSIDAVEAVLSELEVDSGLLTEPWKCEYPL
jgi:hypothetical protein